MSMPASVVQSTVMLDELLRGFAEADAIPVAGIASDSRLLDEGYVFLAVAGMNNHGLDFIAQAESAGIAAVVWDSSSGEHAPDTRLPAIAVLNLAQHLGAIASRFYRDPSSAVKTAAVTGTNGKTTVAWLIAACRQRLGQRCGYIGTLGSGIDTVNRTASMTTPAAVALQSTLAAFKEAGASHAALEVSSHALTQGRVDGTVFDAALFTNLSHDHLDYHGDLDAYFAAKSRLFFDYRADHHIVNVDDDFGARLASQLGADVIAVTTTRSDPRPAKRMVSAHQVVATPDGFRVSVHSSWGNATLELPLPGHFNVANAMLVLAYLLATGVELDDAVNVLADCTAPPGRLQAVASAQLPIVVDYAHTPDALETVLKAIRPHCAGQLWCVIGCGGDRDREKRPLMAAIAERLSDHPVLTSDNPRGEDSAQIIADMVAGLSAPATIIEDRAAAIDWAIQNANDDDLVLIAGKGHENYQEISGRRIPFSDYSVAAAAAAAREQRQ